MGIIVRCSQHVEVMGRGLSRIFGETSEVEVEATTVAEVFGELIRREPDAQWLLDDVGQVRRVFAVYVNEEDIRFLQGMATPVADGDEVSIIAAVCSLYLEVVERDLLASARAQGRRDQTTEGAGKVDVSPRD